MHYTTIIFSPVNPQQSEIIIAELSDFNFNGFEESGDELKAYIRNDYFNEAVNEALLNLQIPFKTEEVSEINWNEQWEKNFEPVLIPDLKGNKNYCFIRASFHKPVKALHEIIITPKMSFGTGHHATTVMMVQQMSKLDFNYKTIADFGTGTGILAIFAEKLGAQSVTANDKDPWCIENSKENFSVNDCNKIEIILSEKFPEGKYDVVLANINLNIIISNLDLLIEGCNENGNIILSGMLVEDIPTISNKLNMFNLKEVVIDQKNNWISVMIKK